MLNEAKPQRVRVRVTKPIARMSRKESRQVSLQRPHTRPVAGELVVAKTWLLDSFGSLRRNPIGAAVEETRVSGKPLSAKESMGKKEKYPLTFGIWHHVRGFGGEGGVVRHDEKKGPT